jgi:4-hydroxy-tetrahydrodipicolinate synthase
VNPFRGVIVASVTPFVDSGVAPLPAGADYGGPHPPTLLPGLDAARIAPLVERAIAAGAHGFLVCGSTGEVAALSFAERQQIVRAAVASANGRIPVFACVGAATTRAAYDLAVDAAQAGAAGLLLQPPWYSLPSVQELRAYVSAVNEVELPLALYNYPARTGVDLRPGIVAGMAGAPNVVAIKESSGDLARIDQLRAGTDGKVAVLCGSDDLAFDFFTRGCEGWISGSANLAPRLHVALYRALVERGDLQAGRAVWNILGRLLTALEQGGMYVQSVKAGIQMLGLPVGDPRPPL